MGNQSLDDNRLLSASTSPPGYQLKVVRSGQSMLLRQHENSSALLVFRQTARNDPYAYVPRGWLDQLWSAYEAGNHGSSRAADYSAGRSAYSRDNSTLKMTKGHRDQDCADDQYLPTALRHANFGTPVHAVLKCCHVTPPGRARSILRKLTPICPSCPRYGPDAHRPADSRYTQGVHKCVDHSRLPLVGNDLEAS